MLRQISSLHVSKQLSFSSNNVKNSISTHFRVFPEKNISAIQNRFQSSNKKNSLLKTYSHSHFCWSFPYHRFRINNVINRRKNQYRYKHDKSNIEKARDIIVPEVDKMTQKQWKFTIYFFLILLVAFFLYIYVQYQRDPLNSFGDAFLRKVAGGSYRDYFYISDPEFFDNSGEHQWIYSPRDEGFQFSIPLHIFVRPGLVVKDEIKDNRGMLKITDDSGTVVSLLWGPSQRSASESKDDTISRWPQKEGQGLKTEYMEESPDKVTAIMRVEADGKLFPEDSWVLYLWRNHRGKAFQISAKYRSSSLVADQVDFLLDKAQHLDESLHID